MSISVVGADFRTASIPARERIALTGEQVSQVLGAIVAEKIFAEAVVLSTCNRTEFYFLSGPEGGDEVKHLLAHVAQAKGADPLADPSALYRYDGAEAVRHLFRVGSALESQIVGEHEILGQVKQAYRLACEARSAKFMFHKVMHWAFHTSKRVMTETALGSGSASVSQAAVDLARQVFATLAGKTVLLVGAGQTAELACQALVRAGATHLIIANRTVANARQLADTFLNWQRQESLRQASGSVQDDDLNRCPALVKMLAECPMRPAEHEPAKGLEARAIGLEEIPSVIASADLVICSTGAAEPVLQTSELAGPLRGIRHSMLMIDLSVPRNIDPRMEKVANVFLYNIDGLEALVARNLSLRQQEIPRANAIVDDEAARFGLWLASLGVVPTIKLLTQRMADLQQAEIARYQRKFPDSQLAQLQEFARTLCAKILHDPITFLRDSGGDDAQQQEMAAVSTIRQIFRLDAPDEDR